MNSESSAANRNECIPLSYYQHKTHIDAQQISVILPVYNKEISVVSMVHLTKLYADKVIIVDEGSWNRTDEIAMKAGAEVIIHKINKGKAVALKTDFKRHELKEKYDI